MAGFLNQLAEALFARHGADLREVAVVLPNRRAALHLRKHLGSLIDHVFWSPQFFTLEEFMQVLSDRHPLEPMEASLELYECYRTIRPGTTEPLHEFLQWAPTTLRDMNEVDAHLVDLQRFYSDLRAIEDLEEWSLAYGRELSPGQARLARYWELKRDLHTAFDHALAARGLGTRGMVDRSAAQRSASVPLPWTQIWFAGLNALTASQSTVIRTLKQRGLASFAWDADAYYLNDPHQEAGRYLRPNIAELGPGSIPYSDALLGSDRTIITAHAPNNVAQCDLAAQLIAALPPDDRERTAVMLADASLLMPLLRALPRSIGRVNVTMGMQLHTLPISGLLSAFLELHDRGIGRAVIHLDRLAAWVMHPFLQEEGLEHNRTLIEALRAEQRPFPKIEDLHRLTADWPRQQREWLFGALEPVTNAVEETPRRIAHVLAWARKATGHDPMAAEQIFHVAVLVQRLGGSLKHRASWVDGASYTHLLLHCLRQERIDLHGEPLEGSQIMGLLETRSIDHDRTILLSAVEGVLPPVTAANSFIPFDVRRTFGLPLPADGDAVAAYGFYRALQRARHVTLIAHTSEGTEVTRYVAQIERELVPFSRTTLATLEGVLPADKARPRPIEVIKSPEVLERIRARLARGLTPTGITSFLNCPLDHWFRHVLGAREKSGVDERLGDDRVGTAVHVALQRIFSSSQDRPLDPDALLAKLPDVPSVVRQAMEDAASGRSVFEGQPLLQAEMAAASIQRYLMLEAGRWKLEGTPTLLALERSLSSPLLVPGLNSPIIIKGTLDRLERRADGLFVVDYKTGAVRPGDTTIRDLNTIPRNKPYSIQLLVYAWLTLQCETNAMAIGAGIVPLRQPGNAGQAVLRIGGETRLQRDQLPQVEAFLTGVVREMLDPAVPIVHDPSSQHCAFCAA